MINVYLADSQSLVRSALTMLLRDLQMQVVGEAADWPMALIGIAEMQPDMLLIEWSLIPANSSLLELRALCPRTIVIILISHLDAREQAALSAGADSFISKGDTADRVAARIQAAAQNHQKRNGRPESPTSTGPLV